jgi:hypothetical protein
MTSKTPPVPPANRSPKGPGGDSRSDIEAASGPIRDAQPDDRTGRQADIKQNTTHQGHQQDR